MKKILSILLTITLLFTIFPYQFIYASDFRWIDITVLSPIYKNTNSGTSVIYEYKNGVYSFEYKIETDFAFNKDASSITAIFSQAQLGDRVTKEINLSGRKMRVYVNLNDLNYSSPKLTVFDFEFTDIDNLTEYDDEVTLISYEDYISERRVFLAKNKNNEYIYVAFLTNSGLAVPSNYSTDTYKVKYASEQPYKGKHMYIVSALEKTTIDRNDKDLYNPSSKTYAGELTSFFMKDKKDNSISYIFTESNSKEQYIVKFSLDDYLEEYYGENINSDTTLEELEDTLIDEYQEGRKISITGFIEGTTDYKKIIIVENFSFLDDNFTRYDKENVFIQGKVLDCISTENSRYIYEIKETTTNLNYYAIFDRNVLGSSTPKTTLSGKDITLHGITTKKGNDYYIGVLSYTLSNSLNETETQISTNDYNIKEISVSTLLSENSNEVLYKGVDSAGLTASYLFEKSTLNSAMPKTSLLNKTLSVAYIPSTNINMVLAWNEVIRENQDYTDKGVLLERTQNNDDSAVYNFKNSYGEIIPAIFPKTIEKSLLEQKGLTSKNDTLSNTNVSLFGNISSYDTNRRFVVKDANLLNELYINKTTADVFTFNGIIDAVVSETANGITYHAKNSYNQYALLYFSKDTLLENFPKYSLLSKNMVVRGLTYSNGIILVTDFNEATKMNTYPKKIEPLYSEPDHFSNMVGFTGVLSLLKAESGKTHITLITSSQRYLLSFESSLQDTLESYIGNMVYLRGEPHPVGNPVWSGSIDVYDISPVCYTKGSCDTFIKPVNTPAPSYQDDGQKKAIHTIQENGQLPENYEYGKAILESLFLPKFILSDENDFFKK